MSAKRSRSPASSFGSMVFGRRSPSLSPRARSVPSSSCQRAKDTVTSPLAGTGSSSARWCQSSTASAPSSTRSIERFFERCLADAAIGCGETLALLAQPQIDLDQGIDRGRHVVALDRRADDRADRGVVSGIAAQRELIDLIAILIDAQNADMAEVMMAAGIDAAGHLDVEGADRVFLGGHVLGDRLRHRDRARRGEAAIIEAGAADDVGDEVFVRAAEAHGVEPLPQLEEPVAPDMRQNHVLLIGDPRLAKAQ